LRSVSRSLPRAATEEENALIRRARSLLGAYARSETMIRAGLYAEGSDPELDMALRVQAELDVFLAESETVSAKNSFDRLALILRRAGAPARSGDARPRAESLGPKAAAGRGIAAIAPAG